MGSDALTVKFLCFFAFAVGSAVTWFLHGEWISGTIMVVAGIGGLIVDAWRSERP